MRVAAYALAVVAGVLVLPSIARAAMHGNAKAIGVSAVVTSRCTMEFRNEQKGEADERSVKVTCVRGSRFHMRVEGPDGARDIDYTADTGKPVVVPLPAGSRQVRLSDERGPELTLVF